MFGVTAVDYERLWEPGGHYGRRDAESLNATTYQSLSINPPENQSGLLGSSDVQLPRM